MDLQTPPPGGQAWSDADIEACHDATGRLGLQWLQIIPDKPPICLDLTGIAQLVMDGKVGNAILTRMAELAAVEDAEVDREEADAEADPGAGSPPDARFWERAQEVQAWQDDVLAAVVVYPPYCRKADLPLTGRPPGALCWHNFTQEQRLQIVAWAMNPPGAAALASFRGEPAGAGPPPDGDDLRQGAERLSADGAPADPPLSVRRGALADVAAPGPRGAGGPPGGAPPGVAGAGHGATNGAG